jgi:hypothetical protein
MAYTPPDCLAANFTALGYYQPSYIRHAYRFPSDVYAAPEIQSQFVQYPYPNGGALNFIVPVNANIEGSGAVTVEIVASGAGEYTNTTIIGEGAVSVLPAAVGDGAHGVAGAGSASVAVAALGDGAHGVAGLGAPTMPFLPVGAGIVERYELIGEVRTQGVLVNRQVRAYRRDTGELVGNMATTLGRFKMHAGFSAIEHYLVPIDLDTLAEDFNPPCNNRIISVLAQDSAQ